MFKKLSFLFMGLLCFFLGQNVHAQCAAGSIQQSLFSQDFEAPVGDAAYAGYGFGESFGGGSVDFSAIGGGAGNFSAATGTANFFVGMAMPTGLELPTTDLSQVYMTADITVTAGAGFAFPINLDFKLEDASSDAGSGANLLNFLTPITSNGTFTVGGALDGASNSGFAFNGNTVIVAAIADFSGNGMGDDITISVDNVVLYACIEDTGCSLSAAAVGSPSACAGENLYSQVVELTYDSAPATGSIDVNGTIVAITGSPQQVTLTDLTADGAAVDLTASFTDENTCSSTSAAAFTAPEACFVAPPLCGDGFEEQAIFAQDFEAPIGDAQYAGYGFGQTFGGGGVDASNIGGGSGNFLATVGTSNFFVGMALPTGMTLPSTDLTQVYMTADITVTAGAGFNFPINMDFKLEDASSDAGTGANLLNFLTPITASGTFTVGGALSGASNTGFSFAGNTTIVAAIADFSGNPLGDDITISVDNVQLYACIPATGCSISAAAVGAPSECSGDNTYSQVVEVTYNNQPPFGFLNVNGTIAPITGSPQQFTLEGLIADGQAVDITASFTEEISCAATVVGAFMAPESCYEAGSLCGDGQSSTEVYSQDFSAPPGDPAYIPFGESFGGGVVAPWSTGDGEGELFASAAAAEYFVGFALPTGVTLPTTDLSSIYMTADMTVEAGAGFNFPANLDFKVEDAASDAGTGANLLNFLTVINGNGTFQIGGSLSSASNSGFQFSGPVSIIAALARFGAGSNGADITITIDNVQLYTCMDQLFLCRTGALYGELPIELDGDEEYTWSVDGVEVATLVGIEFFTPRTTGIYTLSVFDPDSGMTYVFQGRNVADITGCCELDDPCAQPE